MVQTRDSSGFPWRPIMLGPLAVALFTLALYLYDGVHMEVALILLGFAFVVVLVWVVLAARDAESAESPIRQFVPRLTAVLVLGSAFLGFTMRARYPRIPVIEAGFMIFYIAAGSLTMRIFRNKPSPPRLTAFSGGNRAPRQRREARRRS
jgi:hypothetical protein